MNDTLQPKLRQRGRASVDFLAHVFYGTMGVRQGVQEELNAPISERERRFPTISTSATKPSRKSCPGSRATGFSRP